MGKCVYLDTNVIDHLVDHSDGLSQEDADRLVMLSSSGDVEPIFNILGFQEQLGARSEKVERLFDYTLKLFNPDKVVKDSNDLFLTISSLMPTMAVLIPLTILVRSLQLCNRVLRMSSWTIPLKSTLNSILV